MAEENLVVFKGTADGITVLLNDKADFEAVMDHFKQKLENSKAFFQGSKVNIRFKGRHLNKNQQDELMHLLSNQNIVNISFVHQFENEPVIYDKEMLWIKNEIETLNGSMTHFHYGMIRSGIQVDYPGNVIVLGDINPGGVVTAGGHVVVLGSLKGKVHAGLNARIPVPFIISNNMQPIQLGLRNVIAQCQNWDMGIDKKENILQIAYLLNEQIYVDLLDAKSVNQMMNSK